MKYATSILPHDAAIDAPDWESFVKDIAGSICAKQSPDVLLQVRGHLYELLTNCIPPELIFRRLVIELLKKIDDSLKAEVLHWAAFYEHRSHLGSKPMYVLRKRVTLCSRSFFKIFLLQIPYGSLCCAIHGVVQAVYGINAHVILPVQNKQCEPQSPPAHWQMQKLSPCCAAAASQCSPATMQHVAKRRCRHDTVDPLPRKRRRHNKTLSFCFGWSRRRRCPPGSRVA